MTIRYFELPHHEAAHGLLALPTPHGRWQQRQPFPTTYSPSSPDSPDTWYGQVLRQGAGDSLPYRETCPNAQISPNEPPNPTPDDEYIRHILIGSPQGVQETIYLLQARRYVDHAQWSGPIAIGEDGVRITRREGQVLAYLMRRRSLDIPRG